MDEFTPSLHLVADDALGARILAALRPRAPAPRSDGEADVEVRVGRRPGRAHALVLAVAGGEHVHAAPGTVALLGPEDWLVAAIDALLDVAFLSGRISIDLADIRAVFAGRGPTRGVSSEAASLDTAVAGAIAAATDLLPAAGCLVHVAGPPGTPLRDVIDAAEQLSAHADEILFCSYPSDRPGVCVTLLLV